MRILVLTSRYTATRDIISEDFGRQTRLFSALKKLGNEIDFLCADYRKYENKNVKLHGIDVAIRPFGITHFLSFVRNFNDMITDKKYDYVIATSDPLWGVIGYFFAKNHRTRFVYDLHDNYETYATYKIPFLRNFDRKVIKNSDMVTAVSYALKDKIAKIRKKGILVVQNGVDTKLFKPLDKLKCRKELKLPKDAKIIAYTGSIQRLQGINNLIEVFRELNKRDKNITLVIAGRFVKGEERHISLNHNGIIYLKSLVQDDVVKLINAADVVVVPNPKNNFTEYCFPYKIVEYMACNRPIVATDVGDVRELLKKYKDSLCKESDNNDTMQKIMLQLNKKEVNYRPDVLKNSWDMIATRLDKALKDNLR
jgi:glycosyltransferase involved in cell wall biosynthesis